MSEQGPKAISNEATFQIGELRSSTPGPRTRPDFALPPDHPKVQAAIELRRQNDRVDISDQSTVREVFLPEPLRNSRNEPRERPDFALPPDHPIVQRAIAMRRYNSRREPNSEDK